MFNVFWEGTIYGISLPLSPIHRTTRRLVEPCQTGMPFSGRRSKPVVTIEVFLDANGDLFPQGAALELPLVYGRKFWDGARTEQSTIRVSVGFRPVRMCRYFDLGLLNKRVS